MSTRHPVRDYPIRVCAPTACTLRAMTRLALGGRAQSRPARLPGDKRRHRQRWRGAASAAPVYGMAGDWTGRNAAGAVPPSRRRHAGPGRGAPGPSGLLAHAAFALLESPDCPQQVYLPELGPEYVHEHQLAVRALPQQKAAEPLLAGRPQHHVRGGLGQV